MNRKGETDVLEVREVGVPDPRPGQVRVKVAAAGVNFADVMMRRGLYPDAPKLPAVAGYEVSGEVDGIGPGVEEDLLGASVVAMCNFGGYSESICLPRAQVWRLPAGISAVKAAALPVNYLTAWQMVRVMAPVGKGDLVLIHSAAGGVGQAVIQLCKLAGARIIGSASPAKHAYLRDQGLEHVFDSRRGDFSREVLAFTGGRGVDVALEPRHGRWIMESYRSLAKCGRLVLFGFSNAATGKRSGTLSALRTLAGVPWLRINPISLMNDNKSVAGVNLGRMWDQRERTAAWMASLLELLSAGEIAPVIDGEYSFAEAGLAHRRLEDRMNVGKIVLVPGKAVSV
jgi:NADPH:quinone reductase-like Zn-dependent oxidoreductase